MTIPEAARACSELIKRGCKSSRGGWWGGGGGGRVWGV